MLTKAYHAAVIVLLVIAVAILGYGQLKSPSTPSGCKDAIAKAEIVRNGQLNLITGLQDQYNNAVYHTDSVDNINKQIFMANEFEFNALQMIALQNSALLEIEANCR